MSKPLNDAALDILFRDARTHNGWQDKPVPEDLLRRLYNLMKWGPTSFNCSPARLVFVTSQEAKEKLRPALMEGNVEKTMAAPATVIVGHDPRFWEHLPRLFPAMDAKSFFEGNEEFAETTAFRNGTLQGAYLIIAARALGLDVGPMSGFDNAAVDAVFFPDGRHQSNFLANLGYGEAAALYPRGPRLEFEEAARIV